MGTDKLGRVELILQTIFSDAKSVCLPPPMFSAKFNRFDTGAVKLSYAGPGFNSPHLHSSSQTYTNLISKDLILSSGFMGTIHTCGTQMSVQAKHLYA